MVVSWDALPCTALELIVARSDPSELPFLREVSRRWRDAVDWKIKKMQPHALPEDFTKKFPNIQALDLSGIQEQPPVSALDKLFTGLPHLNELCVANIYDFRTDDALTPAWEAMQRKVKKLAVRVCRKDFEEQAPQVWHDLEKLNCHSGFAGMPTEALQLQPGADQQNQGVIRLTFSKPTLTFLDLEEDSFLTAFSDPIVQLQRLEKLRTRITCNDSLRLISRLTSLRSLALFEAPQLPTYCFVFLNSLTGLTELTVGACSVTSFHLCMATALTNLESLNLPLNRGIDDASVGDIAATFPQLTHLDLTETACEDCHLLPRLPSLKSFVGRSVSTEAHYFEALAYLRNLETLDLSKVNVKASWVGFFAFCDMMSLTSLALSFHESSPSKAAGKMTRMLSSAMPFYKPSFPRSSDITHAMMDQLLVAISSMKTLQYLKLRKGHFTSAGVCHLKQLTSLTELCIEKCPNVTLECFFHLKHLRLKYLECDFEARAFKAISPRLALAVRRADRRSVLF